MSDVDDATLAAVDRWYEAAKCSTPSDAHERVSRARTSSLCEPTLPYLRALRDEVATWLASIEKTLDRAEKAREERSREAGAAFVHDHWAELAKENEAEGVDFESMARDLAASNGLDEEEVHEGMRAEFEKLGSEPSACERNGGCATCNWGAADH